MAQPPQLRVQVCDHKVETTIFEDWQIEQYSVPTRRVDYCPLCGMSDSTWRRTWMKSTVRPEEALAFEAHQFRAAPFSLYEMAMMPDYVAYKALEQIKKRETDAELPEGIDPRSKEAVMIHWQQSYQH